VTAARFGRGAGWRACATSWPSCRSGMNDFSHALPAVGHSPTCPKARPVECRARGATGSTGFFGVCSTSKTLGAGRGGIASPLVSAQMRAWSRPTPRAISSPWPELCGGNKDGRLEMVHPRKRHGVAGRERGVRQSVRPRAAAALTRRWRRFLAGSSKSLVAAAIERAAGPGARCAAWGRGPGFSAFPRSPSRCARSINPRPRFCGEKLAELLARCRGVRGPRAGRASRRVFCFGCGRRFLVVAVTGPAGRRFLHSSRGALPHRSGGPRVGTAGLAGVPPRLSRCLGAPRRRPGP